jgi:hypothetical protein
MKNLLLASILALLSTTAHSHGSSHPKWRIHHDYYAKPYMKCSDRILSTEKSIYELRNCGFCDGKLHEYYTNDVLDIDTLKRISLLIEGKECDEIDNYELPHSTFFEIKESQQSLAIKILNESK